MTNAKNDTPQWVLVGVLAGMISAAFASTWSFATLIGAVAGGFLGYSCGRMGR